jgi:glyoxylase I family protein
MATHPQTGAAHHIRLTVTDPARSRDFYTELLGFQVAMEFPDGVLVSNGTLLLGLRTGPDTARVSVGDRFDPNRVGLDHLAEPPRVVWRLHCLRGWSHESPRALSPRAA